MRMNKERIAKKVLNIKAKGKHLEGDTDRIEHQVGEDVAWKGERKIWAENQEEKLREQRGDKGTPLREVHIKWKRFEKKKKTKKKKKKDLFLPWRTMCHTVFSLPLDPILSQFMLSHPISFKIHFNIILTSTSKSHKFPLYFRYYSLH
jgi:hypothetical protein